MELVYTQPRKRPLSLSHSIEYRWKSHGILKAICVRQGFSLLLNIYNFHANVMSILILKRDFSVLKETERLCANCS